MIKQEMQFIGSATCVVFINVSMSIPVVASVNLNQPHNALAMPTGNIAYFWNETDFSGSIQSISNQSITDRHAGQVINLDRKKINRLEKLQRIKELPYNWNKNGAVPISKNVIEAAQNFILGLNIVPEIFPVASGTIQMEYDKNDGSYLEFEITTDKVKMYQEKSNEGEVTKDLPLDITAIDKVVQEFYG